MRKRLVSLLDIIWAFQAHQNQSELKNIKKLLLLRDLFTFLLKTKFIIRICFLICLLTLFAFDSMFNMEIAQHKKDLAPELFRHVAVKNITKPKRFFLQKIS